MGLQRGSKVAVGEFRIGSRDSGPSSEFADFERCCRNATTSLKVLHKNNKTTNTMERSTGVLQKCNILVSWRNSMCHCGTARHNILCEKRLIISMI